MSFSMVCHGEILLISRPTMLEPFGFQRIASRFDYFSFWSLSVSPVFTTVNRHRSGQSWFCDQCSNWRFTPVDHMLLRTQYTSMHCSYNAHPAIVHNSLKLRLTFLAIPWLGPIWPKIKCILQKILSSFYQVSYRLYYWNQFNTEIILIFFHFWTCLVGSDIAMVLAIWYGFYIGLRYSTQCF